MGEPIRRQEQFRQDQRGKQCQWIINGPQSGSSLVATHPLTLACDIETRLETRVLGGDAGRALVAGAGWEAASAESRGHHPCQPMPPMPTNANPCESPVALKSTRVYLGCISGVSPVALKSLDTPEAKHEGSRCVHHVGAVRERAHEAEAVVHLATGDQLHFLAKPSTSQQ